MRYKRTKSESNRDEYTRTRNRVNHEIENTEKSITEDSERVWSLKTVGTTGKSLQNNKKTDNKYDEFLRESKTNSGLANIRKWHKKLKVKT